MTTKKKVSVPVELIRGIKTLDDVKEALQILPKDWVVKSISEASVDVVLMVPKDVSDGEVQDLVNDRMAGRDTIRKVGDNSGIVGQQAQTIGIGEKIKK